MSTPELSGASKLLETPSDIPFPSEDHLYTISMLAIILFPYLLNDWQERGEQEELFIFIILFIFFIFTVLCITDAQDFCGTT